MIFQVRREFEFRARTFVLMSVSLISSILSSYNILKVHLGCLNDHRFENSCSLSPSIFFYTLQIRVLMIVSEKYCNRFCQILYTHKYMLS